MLGGPATVEVDEVEAIFNSSDFDRPSLASRIMKLNSSQKMLFFCQQSDAPYTEKQIEFLINDLQITSKSSHPQNVRLEWALSGIRKKSMIAVENALLFLEVLNTKTIVMSIIEELAAFDRQIALEAWAKKKHLYSDAFQKLTERHINSGAIKDTFLADI